MGLHYVWGTEIEDDVAFEYEWRAVRTVTSLDMNLFRMTYRIIRETESF